MTTEELIIQLIQQDMKHQQLVEHICKAGFDSHMHELDIPNMIAELMGMKDAPDHWMEIYVRCMGRTMHYPISGRSEIFREPATECYILLKNNMQPNG